jgi:hypothetical protein
LHRQVKKADGSDGLQVVYSFKDINKLKVSMNPDAPAGGGMDMGGGKEEEDNPITFAMTKGASPKLTINMPQPDKSDEAEAPAGEEMGGMNADPQAKAAMKQMFTGFRFRVVVKLVDGEIAKSNATYQGLDPKTKKKQYITLMDMDLGKIVQDDAQLEKLSKMGEMNDMVEAKDKLKGIKGLKVETLETVTVTIK